MIDWDTIKDPIFLLLVGGGIAYFILGDLQEALILLGFVTFIVGISLYQEGKTEHALEALRDLSSPRALERVIPVVWHNPELLPEFYMDYVPQVGDKVTKRGLYGWAGEAIAIQPE